MRIVVDLQVCQGDCVSAATRQALLSFARAMFDSEAAHEVWIVLSDRAQHQLPYLRHALRCFDESGKIAVMTRLAGRGISVNGRLAIEANAILRDAFVRNLEPDWMVIAAGFSDDGSVIAPLAMSHRQGHASAVLWLPDIRASALPEPASWAIAAAKHADLVYVASTQAGAPPSGVASAANLKLLPCEFDADPALVARQLMADLSQLATPVRTRDPMTGSARRNRLAIVSPMPPERTGVATYAARLLPGLLAHYDVDVVIDQPRVALPPPCSPIGIRTLEQFIECFADYDRVLYHMGNSAFHARMPALLREFPGTVALHDVYLGDLVNWLDTRPRGSGTLQRALLEGHGYTAAAELARSAPRNQLVQRFECNSAVIDEANGIIVHSWFAASLVARRLAGHAKPPVIVAGLGRAVDGADQRADARRRLDIDDDTFVVASFGFVNHIKLHDRIVAAWLASGLADDRQCRLVFVGEGAGDSCHQALKNRIERSAHQSEISITGYVEDATLADYLSASDVAVQLRSETRGESSGAVFDCLAHGLPVITNGCGALAELPSEVAIRIPLEFSDQELRLAIESLWQEPSLRSRMSQEALRFMAEHHDPQTIAAAYTEAIERFARDGPRARYGHVVAALAALVCEDANGEDKVDSIAMAVAANLPRTGGRQLLIDITPIVDVDLRTGIERVVRAVVRSLVDSPPPDMRVEPVRFADGRFIYARDFMSHWLDFPIVEEDCEVEPRSGDVFLGLAWSPHAIPMAQDTLRRYANLGVRINFIVYDLLPISHPHWFPPGLSEQFRGWLMAVAAIADRIIGISQHVADEVLAWLDEHQPARAQPVKVTHFPLGYDIESTAATSGVPAEARAILASMAARDTFLMIGTVEPRKGHRQVIEAFDELWRQGHDVALAVVGKHGWMTADVEAVISAHAQLGERLLRFESVSDEFLDRLYAASRALLATSYGEGFGLPIVEAARHGVPVIARDIPVFREVAGDNAWYFRGDAPGDLADSIATWIELRKSAAHPSSSGMCLYDWSASTALLLHAIEGRGTDVSWQPSGEGEAWCVEDDSIRMIDFSDPGWPAGVTSIIGLSTVEPWGRWSDATTTPTVELRFGRPLPRRTTISITARAFGPNSLSDTRIAVGDATFDVRFTETDTTVAIDVETDGNQYAIELTPPSPVAPASARINDDARKLGVGLVRIELRSESITEVTTTSVVDPTASTASSPSVR